MANVKVFNMQGAQVGEIALSDEVFGAEVHVSAMHTVVRAYLNAQRQGTQSAKTRTEVRGGGRKIYRQKGTGNARHHGRRAPQFTHGGVVFAPKPRDYRISVLLKALGADKKALIVTEEVDPMIVRASNNIQGVKTTFVGSLNVHDILDCDKFIISQDAVKRVEEVYAE